MRKSADTKDSVATPPKPGGRALERSRLFAQSRGLPLPELPPELSPAQQETKNKVTAKSNKQKKDSD